MSSDLKGFEHFDLLFPSNYLKAGDLQGKEVTVIIDRIEPRHELKGSGGKTDNKPVLWLRTPGGRKIEKAMVCNKTNGKRIMAMYGAEITEWINKAITLRAEKEPKSDSGEAIRVKQERPKLKGSGNGKAAKPAGEPRHDPDTGEALEESSADALADLPASGEQTDYSQVGPPALSDEEAAEIS